MDELSKLWDSLCTDSEYRKKVAKGIKRFLVGLLVVSLSSVGSQVTYSIFGIGLIIVVVVLEYMAK